MNFPSEQLQISSVLSCLTISQNGCHQVKEQKELSWPRTWEMVNVKVESTFLRLPSWYKIPGETFPCWETGATADLDILDQKLHFAPPTHSGQYLPCSPWWLQKTYSEGCRWTIAYDKTFLQTWSFSKLHIWFLPNALQRVESRWCGNRYHIRWHSHQDVMVQNHI